MTNGRDCKPELGENYHRSPSNRAQGHAYRQNACGVTSPTSRPQRHQKKNVTYSGYMPNFVDRPNETIKCIWQSRYPGLLRPFLWASMLNMARLKAHQVQLQLFAVQWYRARSCARPSQERSSFIS